jgi:hypothetical protein
LVLLAGPAVAAAGTITWTYSGALDNAQGDVPLGLAVGSPYTISITLDDSAGVGCTPGVGGSSDGLTNCRRFYNPASIAIELDFGVDCDQIVPGMQTCTSGAVNLGVNPVYLFVENDFLAQGQATPRDSIQFRFYEVDEYDSTHWQRWTFGVFSTDLSSLTSLALPAALPVGAQILWGVCTAFKAGDNPGFCDPLGGETYFRVDENGGIISSVPEPGTMALLGLGLVGLGLSRRRKAD